MEIEKRINITLKRAEFNRKVNKAKRRELLHRGGNKCANCQSIEHLQIDHIVALSMGGENEESNYQILCRTCNLKKGGLRNKRYGNKKCHFIVNPQGLTVEALEFVYDNKALWPELADMLGIKETYLGILIEKSSKALNTWHSVELIAKALGKKPKEILIKRKHDTDTQHSGD